VSRVLVNRHRRVRYITVLIYKDCVAFKTREKERLNKRHACTTKKGEICSKTLQSAIIIKR